MEKTRYAIWFLCTVALTIAVLRPDLFRIVVESGDHALTEVKAESFAGTWTHAAEDWDS